MMAVTRGKRVALVYIKWLFSLILAWSRDMYIADK